jgi:hypothetical protein
MARKNIPTRKRLTNNRMTYMLCHGLYRDITGLKPGLTKFNTAHFPRNDIILTKNKYQLVALYYLFIG